MTSELLKAVERIRPLIQQHAASAEADRRVSGVVYEAMYDAGLFGMLAPRAHGGLEVHPIEAMRIWEAVARTDTAAAWNLVMNQCISAYAAWMSPEGSRELFRHGPPTTAGALNPPAAADRVEGGWRVTGRGPFRQRLPQCALARHAGDRKLGRLPEARSGDRATDALCRVLPDGSRRRSWTLGTRLACAAPARPTTRCRICSCPTG